MPYHSTKNFHKADYDIRQEQLDWEQNDEDYRKEMYDMMKHFDSFDDCGGRTFWYDSVYEPLKGRDYSDFDDSWAQDKYYPEYATYYRTQQHWCKRCETYGCRCSFHFCSCELCYEVCTTNLYDRRSLIQKYYSVQEICDTNERIIREHCKLPAKKCCSQHYIDSKYFPATTSPHVKKEVYKHLLSGKEGIEAFTPQDIDMRFVTVCTVEYLLNFLREEAKECHNQKELNEKVALLAKYGLTLADHEEAKRKRNECH